ncbi:MAG: DPP IV N-terminal domain-containing protein [Bacteroidales bacterium]|nr:DPP IV N-terminal domain-containing protein [Bacteroidales bacterium]MCF8402859.1 DPP IV N-terminal domain-containing protein [Bacteroidales bacterium]
MRKIILFSICFQLLVSFITSAQEQAPADSSKLNLDRIFNSGEFRQDYFGRYKWLGSGDYYTLLERSDSVKGGRDIVKYNTKTGNGEILIDAKDLIPRGEESPLRISNYTWSEDQTKLLIFTNTKRVWRGNTRGDYWVYHINTKELFQLGKELPESSLMFTKFNTEGSMVAFVSGHNLYIQNLETKEVTQLTFDGTEDIINGTFDWVYEEELSCRDGFRWSKDGNYIAFWQLDASEIKDFLMINNTDSIYSYTIPVQYPKAGEQPSAAKVGYIDVNKKNIQWIDLPGDPKQNYIPRMQWVGHTHKLLIQQLNRHQNENKLWLFELESRKMENFFTERDDAWVDIDHPDPAQSHWGMTDVTFLNNERDFLWISERDGWRHIYKKSIAGTDNEICLTRGDYDIASFYGIDEKKGYVYFNASPDNSTQRYLYRVNLNGSGDLTRITPANKAGMNRYDFSPGMKYAVESSSALNRIPTTDLIAIPKYKVVRNLVDNIDFAEKMASLDLGITEFFNVKTADGIEMDGYMIKPPDFDPGKKYPVLFDLYGEPWGQTATDSWGNIWHHFLAQQGYIVMTIDNRGTPCLKGREWRKSIYKKIGVVNSGDQAAATREILKWDFVDPDRIAVWGWSGGGSMTLNLMFRYPDIYSTGMAVAAVSDLRYYDNIYQERYTGIPQENPEVYTEGSPITHAKNLEGNLLVVHGTADDNVHYQSAEALIVELVKHNKKFTMMPYPNCSHGIYEIEGATQHLFTLLTDYLMEHVEAGGK